ncbi:HD domain-containing protein [Actinoallomurus sp. CA-142502]|uniref:caspase family protein n=1 Tax=Actinoallomurus sp. CA-142502 TaxID=3239885 RepID=UPI003D8E7C3F
MAEYRALLIGAAEYESPEIQSIPFVLEDMSAIAGALEQVGYRVTSPQGNDGSARLTFIRAEVGQFLQDAKHGDTCLVYLSGHGVHTEDVDYLVPTDADRRVEPFADACLALDYWKKHIEATKAGAVLFVVDACREGYTENIKSLGSLIGWGSSTVLRVSNRKVGFVFACSPGEKASFVTDDGRTFSLFAEAFRLAMQNESGIATLAELHEALKEEIDALAAKYNKNRQEIRIRTENDRHAFRIFSEPNQRTAGKGVTSWRELAQKHPAWELVASESQREEARSAAAELVGQLAKSRQKSARNIEGDPWLDSSLAGRMSERVAFLLSTLGQSGLSSAEASLLVVMPYLYDTFWITRLANIGNINPEDLSPNNDHDVIRTSFERFSQGYPGLYRRAIASIGNDKRDESNQIGWWLAHQWVIQQAENYDAAALTGIPVLAAADPANMQTLTFAPGRVLSFIKAILGGVNFFSQLEYSNELAKSATLAASTIDEQEVRERFIGYILSMGYKLAIDPARLSKVIVDHVGILDSVSIEDLNKTLSQAVWEPRGSTRVLRAECAHPAVEVALREHIKGVDELLAEIHRAASSEVTISPLRMLFTHVADDHVRARFSDQRPEYQSAGMRFRIAEERVQELLMGERLYGEPALAIRELYQNALDACRYRKARLDYLAEVQNVTTAWRGKILFRQGKDERGRDFIECSDNGVGMGIRELEEAFAKSGVRFTDLPEFVSERSEWEKLSRPIRLFPNSQFGIGVLSYFMLADEIAVTTRRFERDGSLGSPLMVTISGPGCLFRIRPADYSEDSGTTVRLYLRPGDLDLSCVNLLRNLIWVSDFSMEAINGEEKSIWEPGKLSSAARIPAARNKPTLFQTGSDSSGLIHAEGLPVWWIPGQGAILADGVYIRSNVFGAIINLSSANAPQLSVDRKQILKYDHLTVESLMREAVPALVQSKEAVLSFEWLKSMLNAQPKIADLILEELSKNPARAWRIRDRVGIVEHAGCFAHDTMIIDAFDAIGVLKDPNVTARRLFELEMPANLMRWRLRALASAGFLSDWPCSDEEGYPGPARPSDSVIVTRWADARAPFLDPKSQIRISHLIAAAAKTGLEIAQVARRLAELGYHVPEVPQGLTAKASDLQILGIDAPYSKVSLKYNETVPIGHVVFAANRVGKTVAEVAHRLREFGFHIPEIAREITARPNDKILLSVDADGQSPWLNLNEPVAIGHLVAASVSTGESVEDVAVRLAELGCRIPEIPPSFSVEVDDVILMRSDGPSRPTYMRINESVTVLHLFEVAKMTGRSVHYVADRLRILGYSAPNIARDLVPHPDDLILISLYCNSREPWLPADREIPIAHLVIASKKAGKGVSEVAQRLSELGYRVASLPEGFSAHPHDDVLVMSHRDTLGYRREREEPWLDPAEPVHFGHLIRVSALIKATPIEVSKRLQELGYDVLELPGDVIVDASDARIMSYDIQFKRYWLAVNRPVPIAHLVSTSIKTGSDINQLSGRLAEFGFNVPQIPEGLILTREDRIILTEDGGGQGHAVWQSYDEVVPLKQIIAGAIITGNPLHVVAGRLVELGFRVPEVRKGITAHPDDLIMLNVYRHKALVHGQTIPLRYLVAAAARTRRPIPEIAERLSALGISIPYI